MKEKDERNKKLEKREERRGLRRILPSGRRLDHRKMTATELAVSARG